MGKKRKQITLAVTVSVPVSMTTAEARREVRANINHHSANSDPWELGDIRAVRIEADQSQKRPPTLTKEI